MANNDERIILLKERIKDKKEQLKASYVRFTPVTNCDLELDGVRYNLHLHSTPYLMMKLYNLQKAAAELEKEYPFIPFCDVQISGYKIQDWIQDIADCLAVQNYREEKKKLDKLEKELTNLLSDDKQTELKIDELEAMI